MVALHSPLWLGANVTLNEAACPAPILVGTLDVSMEKALGRLGSDCKEIAGVAVLSVEALLRMKVRTLVALKDVFGKSRAAEEGVSATGPDKV